MRRESPRFSRRIQVNVNRKRASNGSALSAAEVQYPHNFFDARLFRYRSWLRLGMHLIIALTSLLPTMISICHLNFINWRSAFRFQCTSDTIAPFKDESK